MRVGKQFIPANESLLAFKRTRRLLFRHRQLVHVSPSFDPSLSPSFSLSLLHAIYSLFLSFSLYLFLILSSSFSFTLLSYCPFFFLSLSLSIYLCECVSALKQKNVNKFCLKKNIFERKSCEYFLL